MDSILTLVSHAWNGTEPGAHLEPPAVDQVLIEMPLFLTAERYVNVPLGPMYRVPYSGKPVYWRQVSSKIRHRESKENHVAKNRRAEPRKGNARELALK